jgi:Ala-tRNA(Pro) deacylase
MLFKITDLLPHKCEYTRKTLKLSENIWLMVLQYSAASEIIFFMNYLLWMPIFEPLKMNVMMKNGDPRLYELLEELHITFQYHEHPPAPTIEEAVKYWKDLDATHCKNIFFRNHKGNRHYLVILDHRQDLKIHDLEKRLKQGKLTFASPERMMKYLGVTPGSVSPLALINDTEKQVHLFIDEKIKESRTISFHPCINTASLVITYEDFLKFLAHTGNTWEYVQLYDDENL